ncbi:FAD-dependent oxidoreductase [Glycomyces sp. TRM65418]|uniref:NAD(P)/FAD-dependent oxidoreductase n=1 Tax=Glycomyces sp. TRM65418 TaxID=2867006 RepID=UPI001CE50D96|nr:FAD-dependent oxidoreductase [Glycomyces sp. TRM65418]MCC3763176.1 FAD-dependent oxidoreductase [Glycomyces sp. TRM65418]QZD57181.1 FAD-dependent oxidoreductase [Glycomyces sp. TRM65418]
MKHRIVVLGAGYAGVGAAGSLARRLHPDDFEITLVNAEPDFVQRLRLHQLAVGREFKPLPLAEIFQGTGVRFRWTRVTAVDPDPDRRTVAVTDRDGEDALAYDTLVYALGSTTDGQGFPGVAEHTFHIASRPGALRLRERLRDLAAGRSVVVVGGGLTGIEAATEIAEARPELNVTITTRGELGDWLSPKARQHLRNALRHLGVAVREHVAVARVEARRVIDVDGSALESDATVWAGGFAVHPIAAASGLEVTETGKIIADRSMRSVSHPEVYAIGDSVHVIGDNGTPLPMSCASAGFTRIQAVGAIVARLTGVKAPEPKLPYLGNNIGLGNRDGVFQAVGADLRPKPWSLRGRPAARFKAFVNWGTAWNAAHPTAGLPTRKRRLAAATAGSRVQVAAE